MNNVVTFNTVTLVLTVGSTVLAIISTAIAIVQSRKNRKVKKMRIDDAMTLHNLSAQTLGAIQGNNDCNNTLKRFSVDENAKKVIYDIGASEGYCQSILIETAKIVCNLKDVTIQEIDDLIKAGILKEGFRHIYTSFAKSN